jgi:hypothetical protein
MSAHPPPVDIPSSYIALPYQHIKVSHVPTSSPTATPVILLTLTAQQKQRLHWDHDARDHLRLQDVRPGRARPVHSHDGSGQDVLRGYGFGDWVSWRKGEGWKHKEAEGDGPGA